PSSGEIWSDSGEIDLAFSWIVQILPQIEEASLADQFKQLNITSYSGYNPTTSTIRPWESQPKILLCPSDSAANRFYSPGGSRGSGFMTGFNFAKGNYAAYVCPEHSRSMRVFPGAMINEPQSLAKISDGTSKTILLAEVRTRDNTSDSRGAWAGAFTG